MSAADAFEFDPSDELDESTDETPRPPRASPWPVLIPAAALLLAIYLEVALAIDARVLGAVPDLALIVLVAIALRFGPVAGASAGFVAGVLLDIAVQGPLGSSSLVLTPVGWAVGWWAERRRHVSLAMALGILLVASVAVLLGDALVAIAIDGQNVAWGTFGVRAVAEVASTLLIGIVALPLLRRATGVPERGTA